MLNNRHGNVLVVLGAMLLALGVIAGACFLVFGDYLIPLMQDAAPYSYLTVLVVLLAVFFFAAM